MLSHPDARRLRDRRMRQALLAGSGWDRTSDTRLMKSRHRSRHAACPNSASDCQTTPERVGNCHSRNPFLFADLNRQTKLIATN
jgi:hypothetical protein